MSRWHLGGETTFTVGQRSVAGRKKRNEEAIGIRIPQGLLLETKGAVAVIADGVSTAEAGQEASQICVTNFLSDYFSTPDTWSVSKSTSTVLTALNRWLYGKGQSMFSAQRGYVCTLSCLIIKSRRAYIFHVGDTRIYRLRGDEVDQLTRDHATRIDSDQTYLTRAVGLDVKLDVDFRTIEVEQGDIFILTSDGIHDVITPADFRKTIATAENMELVCEALIDLATQRESKDNLSCQILRIDNLPNENLNEVYEKLTKLPFPPRCRRACCLTVIASSRKYMRVRAASCISPKTRTPASSSA